MIPEDRKREPRKPTEAEPSLLGELLLLLMGPFRGFFLFVVKRDPSEEGQLGSDMPAWLAVFLLGSALSLILYALLAGQ